MPEYCTVCFAPRCSVSCRKNASVITVVARTACWQVATSRNGRTRRSRKLIFGGRSSPCFTGGPSSGRYAQIITALSTARAAEK